MGIQIPLGSSARLLRLTADQIEAMAAQGALARLAIDTTALRDES